MSITEITSLLAAVTAILLAAIAWRKAGSENRKSEGEAESERADAAERYMQIANLAGVKLLELEHRVTTLEKENTDIKRELAIMDDWARRLVAQVTSLGGTPVQKDITRPVRKDQNGERKVD